MITQTTQMKKRATKGFLYKELTYRIIGMAMKVHKELGPGFLEAVYEEAFTIELRSQRVPFRNQVPFDIYYGDHKLRKKYRADFVIDDKILVEVKKIGRLTKIDEMQVINYLRAADLKVGLVLNFGGSSLQWRRIVC